MALVAAAIASGALGFVFERVIIRQVYGAPLRQILITIGALTVIEQLIIVVWGPQAIPLPKPASLRGSVFLGSSSIETYRLFALFVGLAIAARHASVAHPHAASGSWCAPASRIAR